MTKTKIPADTENDAIYAVLPIDLLAPADDNPRRDLGDLDELAESIKSVGILEPLIVIPALDVDTGADRYIVVAGHRRLAGAKRAGLAEVPCIVRALDEAARAEVMLIENLQREGLSPVEEAGVYERLVRLGVKQRDLAKRIGRSQPHISRRLSLLKLPAKALEAVDTGGITIEQAGALSRLDVEAVEELFEKGEPKAWQIAEAVRRHETEERRAAARKELAEQGIAVVDELPGPNWKHRLDGRDGYGHLSLTPEEHVVEPCHAGHVDFAGRVTLICTDPDRHGPEGDSTLKTPVAEPEPVTTTSVNGAGAWSGTPADPEYVARQEAAAARLADRLDAINYRRSFVGERVRGAGGDDALELTGIVFSYGWYEVEDAMGLRLVAELLNITEDTYNQASSADQVRAFASRGGLNQARAVAAVAVALIEANITPHQNILRATSPLLDDEFAPLVRAYLAFLVRRGYQLSDHDDELIDRSAPDPDAAGAAEGLAWYTGFADDVPRWITEQSELEALAALYPDRLVDLDGEPLTLATSADDPLGALDHTTVIQKAGKKWRVKCSCGYTGSNTTEVFASERALLHKAEAREAVPA